ncbi:MAG: hypothetical protein AB1403_06910 [Candidatus Riflebacteria bacterium]
MEAHAVRLPKEYRFNGKEVYIKRLGNAIILLPKDDWWAPMDRNIGKFTDDFMNDLPLFEQTALCPQQVC